MLIECESQPYPAKLYLKRSQLCHVPVKSLWFPKRQMWHMVATSAENEFKIALKHLVTQIYRRDWVVVGFWVSKKKKLISCPVCDPKQQPAPT